MQCNDDDDNDDDDGDKRIQLRMMWADKRSSCWEASGSQVVGSVTIQAWFFMNEYSKSNVDDHDAGNFASWNHQHFFPILCLLMIL